jgi:cholesterol transport system auxiliary component
MLKTFTLKPRLLRLGAHGRLPYFARAAYASINAERNVMPSSPLPMAMPHQALRVAIARAAQGGGRVMPSRVLRALGAWWAMLPWHAPQRAARVAVAAGMVALLAACSAPAPKVGASVYDFGLLPAATTPVAGAKGLSVADAQVPVWMDSSRMVYRLAYADAARQEAYANTRWAMSPGALFTQRLRQRAAQAGFAVGAGEGLRSAPQLKVDLDEFSQVFASDKQSTGVLVARATLLTGTDGARVLAAQRTFRIEQPAATADAAGGARALADAADAAITQILQWAAAGGK